MSDERLRQLERRWRETSAVEDEAAYLLERVRAGTLTQEQLELAAYCGHRAARSLCQSVESPAELIDWTRGLSRWAAEAPKRAAVGLAALASTRWQEHDHGDSRPHEAARLAQRYLDLPDETYAPGTLLEAGNASFDAAQAMRMRNVAGEENWIWAAGEVTARAAWLLAADDAEQPAPSVDAQQAAEELRVIADDATLFLAEDEARAAMESALVTWALRGTPVNRTE